MSRRGDTAYRFDLLEPDDPERTVDGPAAPEPDGPSWTERTGYRLRRVRGRTWGVVAVGAAGAVVLSGAGILAVHTSAEHRRAAALTAAPGGIFDVADVLDGPPTWSIDTDTGVLAVLPDGVVVTRQGADVLAVDAATGDEQWRHTLGRQLECGPEAWDPAEVAIPVDEVVCLSGGDSERTTTVLRADGTVVGSRDLGDVSDLTIGAAAGGLLVVVEPDGDLPEPRHFSDEGSALASLEKLDGPGAELRFEDALTGDVRGSVDLDFDPRLTDFCLTWMNGRQQLDLSAYSLRSTPALVEYRRCGIDVGWVPPSVDPDAEPDVADRSSASWDSRRRSVDGGLVLSGDGRDRLKQVGAADATALPGRLLDPGATDGVAGPRLVATTTGVVGLDPEDLGGEPVWELAWEDLDAGAVAADQMESTTLMVRADGIAVLQNLDGELLGVDVETGTERWRVPALVDGWMTDQWPQAAVTDGRDALVVLVDGQGRHTLVPLDLETGRTRAEVDVDGIDGLLTTVGGHLLTRTQDSDAGTVLGEDGITRSPGSLQGWGRA